MRAHVRQVMPATATLGVGGFGNLQFQAGQFAFDGIDGRFGERGDPDSRGNQHEAQLIAQLGQIVHQRIFGIKYNLSLQVAADGLGRALGFQFLVHGSLDRHDFVPEGATQLDTLRQFAEPFIPGIEHHRFVALAGQVLPDFIGGERQDRCDPAHQRLGDVVQRGLAGAARQAVGTGGVLAILDDVEVETAQFLHTEVVHLLINVPEAVGAVGFLDLPLQQQGTIDGPAIQRNQLFRWDLMPSRIEPVQVTQQETRGVANTAIGVRAALEDDLGDGHLAGIVRGGHP